MIYYRKIILQNVYNRYVDRNIYFMITLNFIILNGIETLRTKEKYYTIYVAEKRIVLSHTVIIYMEFFGIKRVRLNLQN